jgi:V/A-type H+-transporting ATPase subunit E
MSLADIKSKIEADARTESDLILQKAREQVEGILAKSAEQIEALDASYAERFKKEEPEILNRREIVARLDVNKIDLDAKRELIAMAFDEAVKVLSSMPKEKYLEFVKVLLEKAVETGKEVIYLPEKDKNITKAWLDVYNQEHKTSLTIAKERVAISGGFILRNEDIDTNCSYDMLVSWIREDLEADVVKRLFSA